MDILVCKQPIFNRLDELECYDLYYRSKQFTTLEDDSVQATIELLINTLLSFEYDKSLQNKLFFTKFPQELLLNDFLDTFEHEQLIIELAENVTLSSNFIQRMTHIKSSGFQIAINGATLEQDPILLNELLRYIDFCAIDLDSYNEKQQKFLKQQLLIHHPNIRLLARNVHSREEFEKLKNGGFVLFQGSYFTEPETFSTKEIPAVVSNYFELLALFNEEIPSIGEITEIIEQDVSLSYKILQLASNASNQIYTNITSIRQAIMIIGLMHLQKWIYLLALRDNKPQQSDIELEMLRTSLLRAKICEQLARNKRLTNHTEYFLTGMFSNIDSLLGRTMEQIMEQLPFSQIVKQTLIEQNTEITPFLTLAIDLEKLQFDKIYVGSSSIQISIEQVELIYSNSQSWVDDIFDSMSLLQDNMYQ